MTVVLIADASKPSLVMTSEVIKDKIPGAIVHVAKTGKEALDFLGKDRPDLCVVDFDLPDADGPILIEAMRRVYDGPVLLTAYPAEFVKEAVQEALFLCTDASSWLSKPVSVDALNDMLDKFLVNRHRLGKRFDSEFSTQLIGKAAGRGKRAPKVKGKIINISLGGACIEIVGGLKVKKAQELTMTFGPPEAPKPVKPTVSKSNTKSKTTGKKAPAKAPAPPAMEVKERAASQSLGTLSETKLKGKVAWVGENGGQVGIQFAGLTEVQKKGLLQLLKQFAEMK